MMGKEYILTKQTQWAKSNGIHIVGSTLPTGEKDRKGIPAYTTNVNDNLFEPLLSGVKADLNSGDGGEFRLRNKGQVLPKFQAVHSSSAIGVNFFQYWKDRKDVTPIAHACGLCSKANTHLKDIRFEGKFPISTSFPRPPNIDVVIEHFPESPFDIYAIECKFSEAYGGYKHSGLNERYFDPSLDKLWKTYPNLKLLAETIKGDDTKFHHLHAAQLIKHILGLQNKVGKSKFRLLYLWYDVPDEDGCVHRTEIENFSVYTRADKINFSHISYQDVICNLVKHHYVGNEDYINYLSSRYL